MNDLAKNKGTRQKSTTVRNKRPTLLESTKNSSFKMKQPLLGVKEASLK